MYPQSTVAETIEEEVYGETREQRTDDFYVLDYLKPFPRINISQAHLIFIPQSGWASLHFLTFPQI